MDETLKMGAALAADNVAGVVTLYLHGGVELDALSDTLLDDNLDGPVAARLYAGRQEFILPVKNILLIVEKE